MMIMMKKVNPGIRAENNGDNGIRLWRIIRWAKIVQWSRDIRMVARKGK